jgi:hypothetical protein
VSLLTYHCVGNQNFDTKENILRVNSCLRLITKKKLPLYHVGKKTKNKITVIKNVWTRRVTVENGPH